MAQTFRKHIPQPVIGVTGNNKKISPSWYCLRLAIWLAGGKALRIHHQSDIDRTALDGLVISGGDDIHPAIYGSPEDEATTYDRERDAMEIDYIRFALKKKLPLLGICRGHQLINAVLGGSLHSTIRTIRKKTSNRPSLLPTKNVFIEEQSRMAVFLGKKRIKVNSLHDQAIDEVADGLVRVAEDRDGIIQAIESVNGNHIFGVQWHPEYLLYLPSHFSFFRWLVAKSKESAKPSAKEVEQ